MMTANSIRSILYRSDVYELRTGGWVPSARLFIARSTSYEEIPPLAPPSGVRCSTRPEAETRAVAMAVNWRDEHHSGRPLRYWHF